MIDLWNFFFLFAWIKFPKTFIEYFKRLRNETIASKRKYLKFKSNNEFVNVVSTALFCETSGSLPLVQPPPLLLQKYVVWQRFPFLNLCRFASEFNIKFFVALWKLQFAQRMKISLLYFFFHFMQNYEWNIKMANINL